MPASRKPTDAPAAEIDVSVVEALAKLISSANVTEIEVSRGDLKIRVSRAVAAAAAPAPIAVQAAPVAAAAPPAAPEEPSASADPAKHPGAVKSPMVGTCYVAPQPGAPAFVKVGDTVKEGQTLLIVEAMKTMNPIPAPRAGKIVQILVQDAEPVEYGQALMIVE